MTHWDHRRHGCEAPSSKESPAATSPAAVLLGAVLAALPFMTAFAAETDCIGESEDGRAVCSAPDPSPWGHGLCDETAAWGYRINAWCVASGGTVNAAGDCVGATIPTTEATLYSKGQTFSQTVHSNTSCNGTYDSGWGISSSSNFCWSGSTITQDGIAIRELRHIRFTCTSGDVEGISALRGRQLACPTGTTSKTWNGQQVCVHPVGHCQCRGGEGNPILPETGQKVQVEDDGMFDGRRLARYYSSFGSIFAPGSNLQAQSFGPRWHDAFDYRLQPMSGTSVIAALSLPNGSAQFFRNDGTAVLGTETGGYRIVATGSGHDVTGHGELLRFDTSGRLVILQTAAGRTYTLTYSDGTATGSNGQVARDANDLQWGAAVPANQLIRVESDTGRILRYERDVAGKITQMRVGAGDPVRYHYTDIDLLAKVVHPGGQARLYHYNEPAQTGGANLQYALTGISDLDAGGNPVRYATFVFAASGKAISTQHAGGSNRYDLQFVPGSLQTVVTDPLGTQRSKSFGSVSGVRKLVSITQPSGSGSAEASRTLSYDAHGNVASVDDFNGTRTCSGYEASRGLETVRVEGLPGGQPCPGLVATGAALPIGSRKTSTQWHADWPMEARLAEPGRITTKVYHGQPDPFDGNAVASCAPPTATLVNGRPIAVLCRRVEQATTDVDGSQGFSAPLRSDVSARENRWTYNARGQVLTHDGPRTDVSDVTTHAYYPDTTAEHTRGDLQSVVNAAGHATQYTSYDGEGRLRRSIAANGAVTDNTFTPRGWLAATTTVAGSAAPQTTTYTYEVDGRLATVTLPDGTRLTFAYDPARRLVGITDGAANAVTYTLDGAGNRVAEQLKDASGTLVRDIERVYDALGRVMSSTGVTR